ncbi:MAG: L-histidine N(alpha)-methyltransferase [Nanoarchaeota archaeon]|nr:L-histidine N(alpha)-methyltransferase [Nanoarchaeota archaeon]MBU1622555.1 L-histidine N(alpha)-methyltransferase [Nanoarchaeota archaeon]
MNEQIEKIVRQHLQENYSDSLTRFSYLNGGAEQFIRLTQNPDYTSYERELNLINQILPNIKNLVGSNLQIIDFGVGDGRKLNQILSSLRESIDVSYLGLDLSPTMIEVARINNRFGDIYSICDFSNMGQLTSVFERLHDSERLIFMLGNTITNEVDVESYLHSLRSITERQTYLAIGLELFQDNVDEIVREYRNEENYNLTFRPLEMIGIERNHGQIDIDFNPERQRIEEWFIFNQDGQVRDIQYQEGDRVLLSVTYKPTMTQIREMINNNGWNEEMSIVDRGYALLLLSSD